MGRVWGRVAPHAIVPTLYNAGIYRECAAGLADQVRVYLEKAEREGRLRQALNERGSSRGRGLLHVAALNNQLECLDVLLHDFGAPCNPRSLLGRDTPLHLAAQQGHRKACLEPRVVPGRRRRDDPEQVRRDAAALYDETKLSVECS